MTNGTSHVGGNRSMVLDLIRSEGVVSRVDLVEKAGLTAGSITRIVKGLIDEGLVVETGLGDSTGGKRPTLLELNASSRFAIGVAFDDTRLTYVITDLAGTLIARSGSAGRGEADPPTVVARVCDEIAMLLKQAHIDRSDVVGVGVAVSARIDQEGRALRGSREDWENYPLGDALEEASGFRVVVESDSACAALGEFWVGRIPMTRDFVTLYMANGIGCAIVIDGSVYGGTTSQAGKIGHVIVDIHGPLCASCGSRGCVEMLAAPYAVVQRALLDTGLRQRLGLDGGRTQTRADFALIAAAASQGDVGCVGLIEESATYVAKALISLANLIDMDHLYLAGPAFADAGSIYYRVIHDELQRFAYTRFLHPIHVQLSKVGLEPPALGAAAALLQRVLTPRHGSATR